MKTSIPVIALVVSLYLSAVTACNPKSKRPSGDCYNKQCDYDICAGKKCYGYPYAVCKSTICKGKCEYGFFVGQQKVHCKVAASPCQPGYYQVGGGRTTECRICGPGTYRDHVHSHCQVCPAGKTTLKPGATSYKDCAYARCGAGYYRSSGRCSQCDQGYYQNKVDQGSCLRCPLPKVTRQRGATSLSDCVWKTQCNGGNYRDLSGMCKQCSKGYYQVTGNYNNCVKCPSGRTTNGMGAMRASDCIAVVACYAGSYREGDQCKPCAVGYYQDQRNTDHCYACPPGFSTGHLGSRRARDCVKPIRDPSFIGRRPAGDSTFENPGPRFDTSGPDVRGPPSDNPEFVSGPSRGAPGTDPDAFVPRPGNPGLGDGFPGPLSDIPEPGRSIAGPGLPVDTAACQQRPGCGNFNFVNGQCVPGIPADAACEETGNGFGTLFMCEIICRCLLTDSPTSCLDCQQVCP